MRTELDQNHIHVACGIVESNGLVLAAQCKLMDVNSPEMGVSRWQDRRWRITGRLPEAGTDCLVAGIPTNHEHEAIVWLPPEHLMTIDWAEADIPVAVTYQKAMSWEVQMNRCTVSKELRS
jgi:hypothetical protein